MSVFKSKSNIIIPHTVDASEKKIWMSLSMNSDQ